MDLAVPFIFAPAVAQDATAWNRGAETMFRRFVKRTVRVTDDLELPVTCLVEGSVPMYLL